MNKPLKSIGSFDDLKYYGVNLLTGERDNLFLGRLLCDLSQDGVELVRDYFGLPRGCVFDENWNGNVGDEPAIASVMLTRETLVQLCVFALLQHGAPFVYQLGPEGFPCYDDGEYWQQIDEAWSRAMEQWKALPEPKESEFEFCRRNVPDCYYNIKRFRGLKRNFAVHQMSGRQ
jgi:hypothetical protein